MPTSPLMSVARLEVVSFTPLATTNSNHWAGTMPNNGNAAVSGGETLTLSVYFYYHIIIYPPPTPLADLEKISALK